MLVVARLACHTTKMERFAGPHWQKRQWIIVTNLKNDPYFRALAKSVAEGKLTLDHLKAIFLYPDILDKFIERWALHDEYDYKNFGTPIKYEFGIRSLPATIRNPDAIKITVDPLHYTKEEILDYFDRNFRKMFSRHNGKSMPRPRLAANYDRRNRVWMMYDARLSISEIARRTGEDPDWIAKTLRKRTLKLPHSPRRPPTK